jgi:hypothetical protein
VYAEGRVFFQIAEPLEARDVTPTKTGVGIWPGEWQWTLGD